MKLLNRNRRPNRADSRPKTIIYNSLQITEVAGLDYVDKKEEPSGDFQSIFSFSNQEQEKEDFKNRFSYDGLSTGPSPAEPFLARVKIKERLSRTTERFSSYLKLIRPDKEDDDTQIWGGESQFLNNLYEDWLKKQEASQYSR